MKCLVCRQLATKRML